MLWYYVAMFIDVVPNRSSPPAVLLREAWREGTRIRKRTLANLSSLAPALAPSSKLATARALLSEAASSTLLDALDLEPVDEDACYAALDWLLAAQPRI